jgi:hypothetical protein
MRPDPSSTHPPAQVVAIGILALAVAMGIGRFAFTPLLPLMLRDGSLSAARGAEWAAANYAGYLLGALTAARFAAHPQQGLRLALAGVALSTLGVGLLEGTALAWGGLALRTAAGVFSAWALVCASSWCLVELARQGQAARGAWMYTGVGLGLAAAGAFAWLGGGQPARWLWLELGVVASAGAAWVAWQSRGAAHTGAGAAAPAPARRAGHGALVLCYGVFGFGYIVPATFLPAMARAQVDDPLVFGLTWPLFGLAAAASVATTARWLARWPRRRVWALAQGVMALGTALSWATQALWALVIAAVLVGGTFMVATMAGLQLAREQAPEQPAPLLARMTVAFALGQIAGPLLVRALAAISPAVDTLAWANAAATVLLAGTAAWLWRGASAPAPRP